MVLQKDEPKTDEPNIQEETSNDPVDTEADLTVINQERRHTHTGILGDGDE